jgi:hypothetical protein
LLNSGAWGKQIREKKQNRKSRDTVPLKEDVSILEEENNWASEKDKLPVYVSVW